MPSKQSIAAIIISAVAVAAVAAVIVATTQNQAGTTFATDNPKTSSLTIITTASPGGSMVGGATYIISPSPLAGSGNYTIQDGSSDDENPVAGIIAITAPRDGSFLVTQLEAPAGYARDKLSKVAEINQSSDAVTFSIAAGEGGSENDTGAQIREVLYTAKFECGTIQGDEGPLRPGHYDTDIGMFNKQKVPVKIFWSAAANDGRSTNSFLKTLEPQTSTGIVCNDLRKSFGNGTFVEGFVLIRVPLDPGIVGTLSGTAILGAGDDIDVLEVQAFYTANALPELPHEILVDKITFAISNDTSSKIPASMIGMTLDITVPSQVNEISDPASKVKEVLAEKYSLTEQQIASLEIEIKSVGVGVGTMIDDHAISLSKLRPQPVA